MSSATLTATSIAQAQPLTERPAWKTLAEHYQTIRGLPLRQLFAEDPRRGERLSIAAFSLRVRSGEWLGYTGERIRNIISIAINGASNWAKRWQSGQSPNLKARTNRSSSMTARPTR